MDYVRLIWSRLFSLQDVIDPLHRRKPTRYMVKGLVGAGKYRKLLLSAVLLPYQKQLAQYVHTPCSLKAMLNMWLYFCRRKVPPATEVKKDPSEPALTIEFARMCLINALATVNRHLNRYFICCFKTNRSENIEFFWWKPSRNWFAIGQAG